MNDNENTKIPYIAFETELARSERHIKRLWITTIILILLLVGSNVGWLIYESQFEEVEQSVLQDIDTGEGNAVVNGIGDLNYGNDKTSDNSQN